MTQHRSGNQRMNKTEITEFALLHREIQEMKNNTSSELADLKKAIDRILITLVGDNEMAQEGLVKKVERHEKYIEDHRLIWAKLTGIAIGGGAIGGVLIDVFFQMFTK